MTTHAEQNSDRDLFPRFSTTEYTRRYTAIREAMARGQKYGTVAIAIAARVVDILRTYKR